MMNYYIVYDEFDRPLIVGTARECAERIGVSEISFRCMFTRFHSKKYADMHPTGANQHRKYYIYKVEENEDE